MQPSEEGGLEQFVLRGKSGAMGSFLVVENQAGAKSWQRKEGGFGGERRRCIWGTAPTLLPVQWEAGKANDYGSLMKNIGYTTCLRNQVQKYNIFKKPVFGDLLTKVK